jgi:hypothetical protein
VDPLVGSDNSLCEEPKQLHNTPTIKIIVIYKMKFSLLTLASLVLGVTATPVTLNLVEGDAPLEKRASETVYLSNCNVYGSPFYSQMNVCNLSSHPFPLTLSLLTPFPLIPFPRIPSPLTHSHPTILSSPIYPPTHPLNKTQYYSNGANSQNGEQPDDTCYLDLSGYVTWEGNSISGTFSGGTTFTSHIDSTAQSRALYTYSGYGRPYLG